MAWEYLQLLLELSSETRSKHDRSAASWGQVFITSENIKPAISSVCLLLKHAFQIVNVLFLNFNQFCFCFVYQFLSSMIWASNCS